MNASFKNIVVYLFLAAIFGILGYQITIAYLPNFIYNKVHKISLEKTGADNVLSYPDLPTDSSRSVVLPNPDFLYISCFYDISKNPIHFKGILPDSSYWSVAFYQPNTINWYVKNDTQYPSNQLDLVLVKKGTDYKYDFKQSEIAASPTNKGFMLIRILVTDNSDAVVQKFRVWQKSVKLEVLDIL
jgi:uncharacterized membrane protein